MNEVNHPVDQILSRACKHGIDPSKKVRGEVCTAITGKSHMFISDIRSGFMLDGFFTCQFLSITSDTAMKLLYLILLTSSTTVLAKRVLHQSNGGCSSSPGMSIPDACSGGLFSGNEWDNDEIECNFDGVQLKCDLDEDTFSDNDVDCELEVPGDDIEFSCNVDANCNIKCSSLSTIIPAAYLSTVQEILDTWKPDD
jgi:hypothetical protein